MQNSSLDIQPVTGTIGAEIAGIDLAAPQPDGVWTEIRQALNRHGVIFFRDQNITPQQEIDFARHFGTTCNSAYQPKLAGFPELVELRKEPNQKNNVGGNWHTDHAFKQAPPMGTIVLARETPAFGGDTLFISMAAAYDALSDGLKQTLDGLQGFHTNAHNFGPNTPPEILAKRKEGGMVNLDAAVDEAVHPVVVTHPETGRRSLYVNPGYLTHFVGWTKDESQPLIKFLCQHAQRPEYMCRFRWTPGAMAFFDNRQCWHYATNDYNGHRRVMHRIMVEGEPFKMAQSA